MRDDASAGVSGASALVKHLFFFFFFFFLRVPRSPDRYKRLRFIVLIIRVYSIFPSVPVDLCVLKGVELVWNTTSEESSPLFNQAL